METTGCSTDPNISGGSAALVDDALYILYGYSDVNGRTNSVRLWLNLDVVASMSNYI